MINLKQLLTESAEPKGKTLLMESADYVRSGLEKVFSAGDKEVSVRRCENVGLGYIKSISEAIKVAKSEAQKVAKQYGYRLDEDQAKFVKENDFSQLDAQAPESALAKVTPDETDMSNPAERTEVQIAQEILKVIEQHLGEDLHPYHEEGVNKIKALANELLTMHGQSPTPSAPQV